MSLKLQAEMAFGYGFKDPASTWVWRDVTPYLVDNAAVGVQYAGSDKKSQPGPNGCSLTLDNNAGEFTPGLPASPFYPNVVKGVPVRVSARHSGHGSGNLLTANQASVETSAADWATNTALGAYTAATAVAQSAVRAQNGTKSVLATWPLTAIGSWVGTVVTGLVVGRTYIASGYVYAPSGNPDPRLEVIFINQSARTSTKDAWVRLSCTFTAIASTAFVGFQVGSATAGQQLFMDSLMVDEGTTLGAFTTTPLYGSSSSPGKRRFTGYVNEFPITWPKETTNQSQVTISCSSRKARLGQTRKLPSAIRAANLSLAVITDKGAYWPLEEAGAVKEGGGHDAFRDITNPILRGRKETQALAAFAPAAPVLPDGTSPLIWYNDGDGPTDEGSLVKFTRTTDPSSIPARYIGSGDAMRIGNNLAGGHYLSFSCVARIDPIAPSGGNAVDVVLMRILSANARQAIYFFAYDNSRSAGGTNIDVGIRMQTYDNDFTVVEDPVWSVAPGIPGNTDPGRGQVYRQVTDGQIHHFYVKCYWDAATPAIAQLFVDGEYVAYVQLSSLANNFSNPFTQLTIGDRTLFGDAWIGHATVDDLYVSDAAIAQLADGCTAASETLQERVVRLGAYLGVDSAEISVEASWAAPLGSQPEKDQSATAVLDEAALSTGGSLYDDRDGLFTMQARNHRYNAASSFTLTCTSDHFTGLAPTVDDQDLLNYVSVQRAGTSDEPLVLTDETSRDRFGDYDGGGTISVVSSSDLEVEAYGSWVLARNSQTDVPKLRISQITVNITALMAGDAGDIALALAVLNADVGTRFTLAGLPAQLPSSMPLFVEGASETISETLGHSITFNTTPGDLDSPIFVPDDSTYGVLDVGNLIAF